MNSTVDTADIQEKPIIKWRGEWGALYTVLIAVIGPDYGGANIVHYMEHNIKKAHYSRDGTVNFLMCWPESVSSAVHDHADSHCFMRILAGNARETRHWWPKDLCAEDGSLLEMSRRKLESGQTAYMSDELGLHRVENESHTEKLCSLHLYSPPFADCNIFDQRTSKKTPIKMTFFSKFGEKEDHRPKAKKNV